MFQVLNSSPPVLYAMLGNSSFIFDVLKGRLFHVYLRCPWYKAMNEDYLGKIADCGGSFTICANSEEELFYYQSLGFDCILCHHNAFLDWSIHRLLEVEKEFDFVINSVLRPYKRHELLPKGFRFAMISRHDADELEWEHLQPAWKNQSYLTAEEVNLVHNQSRIGVILSEQEGGCGASTEYLLAGLPVISTPSKGGRDLFYDSGNSIICEPTVDGVRSALNQALAMEWSQQQIRNRCISLMQSHRDRFVAHLSNLIGQDGTAILQRSFTNRLMNWFPTSSDATEYLRGRVQS